VGRTKSPGKNGKAEKDRNTELLKGKGRCRSKKKLTQFKKTSDEKKGEIGKGSPNSSKETLKKKKKTPWEKGIQRTLDYCQGEKKHMDSYERKMETGKRGGSVGKKIAVTDARRVTCGGIQ